MKLVRPKFLVYVLNRQLYITSKSILCSCKIHLFTTAIANPKINRREKVTEINSCYFWTEVKFIANQSSIWHVMGSNLSPEIIYSDKSFVVSLSPST